jgi:hypothetical protein
VTLESRGGFLLAEHAVSWERPFDQPVPLPGERPARTLRDAGNYIRKLPESERDAPELRLAVQMLIDAAEDRGPVLFAKMGMDRALNRMDRSERSREFSNPIAKTRIRNGGSWPITDSERRVRALEPARRSR